MSMAERSAGEIWETRITAIDSDVIQYRGYPVQELIGRVGYSSVVYLLLTGNLPDRDTARIIDAVLVSSMDHGATPPSTLAARTAAGTGAPLNAALAAGILSINEYHGGAIERCMEHLLAVREHEERTSVSRELAAQAVVEQVRARGDRLSGFGHRVHRHDPRAGRLFEIAADIPDLSPWIERARALEHQLEATSGRALPLNVDGAIATLLAGVGMAPALANGLFMIARLPGLLAHVVEERGQQKPMRRIVPGSERYAGPTGRRIETDAPDTTIPDE